MVQTNYSFLGQIANYFLNFSFAAVYFAGLQDGPSECAALGYAKPLESFKGDCGRTWMHQKTKGYFTVDFCPEKLSPKMHAVSPAYGFMQFLRSGSP